MPTLFEPPPLDESKAPIENVLELTPVVDVGPDVFTNTRPLWHPPGARGIFGGAAIAQSLSAAMRTVPRDFAVHSMHCYFVLAGDSEIPVIYHVERVRDGRSFITRTVQARQRGRPIFTTTLSFSKVNSGGKRKVEHATPKPAIPSPDELPSGTGHKARIEVAGGGPFESRVAGISNRMLLAPPVGLFDNNGWQSSAGDSPRPEDKKVRRFLRARGRISEAGGHEAHLSAVAYASDSFFIGTVNTIHGLPFNSPARLKAMLQVLDGVELDGNDPVSRALGQMGEESISDLQSRLEWELVRATELEKQHKTAPSMVVSLDHSIYFHNPLAFRADEWMLTEMESPWAGEGRGLVFQKIWSRDGTLIATCTQEGVIRLSQDEPRSKI
ncbi:hypothetical protein MPDQ_003347 [Monascus purpureus]|uniref:Acyl-CoA thioesterase 8 n=1 Tax=Monascus purpureus TaxID=5098 RepID=A0A507QN63_MONPU|nr:hypothetical protein MPDQ_003347 [Monascus purpureus]BDD57245.1 hypothetical protein MAP00_002628 [Monascus purpureus]